jgi:hypothetical protein
MTRRTSWYRRWRVTPLVWWLEVTLAFALGCLAVLILAIVSFMPKH